MSDIPKHKRVKVSKHHIIWKGDGKIKVGWLATIDHIRPRCRGGKHYLDNIVPACHDCNQMRAKFMDPRWKSGKFHKHNARKGFIIQSWTNRIRPYWQSKKVFLAEETRGGGRVNPKTVLRTSRVLLTQPIRQLADTVAV